MIVPMVIKKKKKKIVSVEQPIEQVTYQPAVEPVYEQPRVEEIYEPVVEESYEPQQEETIIEDVEEVYEQPQEELEEQQEEILQEVVYEDVTEEVQNFEEQDVVEEVEEQSIDEVEYSEEPEEQPIEEAVEEIQQEIEEQEVEEQPVVEEEENCEVEEKVESVNTVQPKIVINTVQKPIVPQYVSKGGLGKTMIFTLKLSNANPIVQENYDRINNAILSYEGTERFYENSFVEYKKNDKVIARLIISGNALILYLDLAHSVADQKIFFHKETDDVKGLRIFMNVKSDKAGKNAVDLIDIMANKKHFTKIENYQPINSIAELKELNKR